MAAAVSGRPGPRPRNAGRAAGPPAVGRFAAAAARAYAPPREGELNDDHHCREVVVIVAGWLTAAIGFAALWLG